MADLSNLTLDKMEIEKLEIDLQYLNNLTDFLQVMEDDILPAYDYIINSAVETGDTVKKVKKLMRRAWEVNDDREIRTELRQEIDCCRKKLEQ